MTGPKMAMAFIETVGLVTAIAAADAALKSADVTLIGRETSKGGGMITVKLAGRVGAVKAAVLAAEAEGNRIGKVVSVDVIARPLSQFARIMAFNEDTVAVESWIKSVAPDLNPGRVIRVEGKPSVGNLDLWQIEKKDSSSKPVSKRGRKTSRKKNSKGTIKETSSSDLEKKKSNSGVKKRNSRRGKRTKRDIPLSESLSDKKIEESSNVETSAGPLELKKEDE